MQINLIATSNATWISLVSNIKSSVENAGFELPLGIDKSIGGIGTVIAITGMTFTPSQAGFDAATVVNLSEAGMKAAFGARNICMDKASLCGQGTLFLARRPECRGSTGLRLKAAAPSFSSPADSGSYVVFDKEGFKRLRVRADYDLPTGLFSNKLKPGQPVVASLGGRCRFLERLAGGSHLRSLLHGGQYRFWFFACKPGSFAIYDHSSTRNPPGMPSIPEKTNITTPDWNGFFMPEMVVDLATSNSQISTAMRPLPLRRPTSSSTGMGLTGTLNANHLTGHWQWGSGLAGTIRWIISTSNSSITPLFREACRDVYCSHYPTVNAVKENRSWTIRVH